MKGHVHPCSVCQTLVRCGGDYERNHDGEPAWICPHYHLPNGMIADVRCSEHTEMVNYDRT